MSHKTAEKKTLGVTTVERADIPPLKVSLDSLEIPSTPWNT
ncbi:hypothetical protein F3D3_1186 [Fusibacter sp. 3D3]|nr:hypothetical protein F3D3_1186 [Fusibacter sp. 3D3]